MKRIYTALSIAGSDCSGGAGIQADLKTFSALGVYGMSVITSIVAENTRRVRSVFDVPPEMAAEQLEAVFEDIDVDCIKIGMLKNQKLMQTVLEKLKKYQAERIVCDPVMLSKDGTCLMEPGAVSFLKRGIIPVCTVFTPNIPEAEVLLSKTIASFEDMKQAAKELCAMGCKSCLLKGGHFSGDPADILFDGEKFHVFSAERIPTKNTHGTGCTLSSAICAYLAKGEPVPAAVEKSKKYITGAIAGGLEIGKGNGPLNHFYFIENTDLF